MLDVLKISIQAYSPLQFLTCGIKLTIMEQGDIEDVRRMITAEIEKTRQSIKQYKDLTKPIAPENAIGRVSRMDAINNRSVTEAALRTAERKLKGLEVMLPKLGEKDFGLCVRCKNPIPVQRILLVPQSQFCVNCAR